MSIRINIHLTSDSPVINMEEYAVHAMIYYEVLLDDYVDFLTVGKSKLE